MNTIWDIISKNKVWFLALVVIIVLRFIWIDRIPTGMQYDEIEYSISSKSFQLMGTDLSGVGFPQSLFYTKTLGKISPFPIMILAPVWFFLDLTIATFRSLYVILNILTAFVFMYLVQVLFKNKPISFLSGVLFLLNPWSFFLSRHGMDGSFALIFYLLGTIFLLKDYSKKNLLLSFLFYFLGCFSYHGAKLALVPLAIIVSIYKISTSKVKNRKIMPYATLVGALALTIIGFVIAGSLFIGSILDTRSHEFVFTNADKFAEEVVFDRTASIVSPIHNIMINKYIYAANYFFQNYFEAFSPSNLFLHAEILEFSGFFYVFEIVILLFGLVMLFAKKRAIFWLLVGITIIAPISTATSLSGYSIVNRGILLLPIFLTFITFGLFSLYEIGKQYVSSRLVIAVISVIYIGNFFFFQYIYFFILPVQLNMHYQTPARVIARYVKTEQNRAKRIEIISSKPQVLFSELTFFLSRKKQEQILKEGQTFGGRKKFVIDNITISNECATEINPDITYIIDHDKIECLDNIHANYLIVNQKDAGVVYSIQNGNACDKYMLTRYRAPHFMSDFAIETMSDEQFCTRWIAQ
ncbi:MAG TPA: hypothetical protein PLS49_00210 [Candidatus Woesebacteria bacterium]|nr:hypothetical protein [Candidatus Woesebacteria bacterium]